jgi:hypothetical protein
LHLVGWFIWIVWWCTDLQTLNSRNSCFLTTATELDASHSTWYVRRNWKYSVRENVYLTFDMVSFQRSASLFHLHQKECERYCHNRRGSWNFWPASVTSFECFFCWSLLPVLFSFHEARTTALLADDLTSNSDTCDGNIYILNPALDNLVGIVTRYGLDCPGVEARWDEIFALFWTGPGATQSPLLWVPGLFSVDKEVGAWHSPPTPSNADFKEKVKL